MTAPTSALSPFSPPAVAPESPNLLVIAEDLTPFEQLRAFLAWHRGRVHHVPGPIDENDLPEEFDVVVIVNPDPAEGSEWPAHWLSFATGLERRRVSTLLVGGRTTGGGMFTCWVSGRASADELSGRIQTMARYGTILRSTEHELARLEQMRARLNHHFEELDQEMRLAGRLQRDFLPREMPRVGRLRFATLFQPASWVSGDIYDGFRLDEKTVGFYLADAVGHGVAAGLLTMFIKRAMQTKTIEAGNYRIVSPDETLTMLNDALASQQLPNCQFVTVCYGIVNEETLRCTIARGGHPYPIHISSTGQIREISAQGGLLGVFGGQKFAAEQVQLAPGDKLILYSDGLEHFFVGQRDAGTHKAEYPETLKRIAGLPAEEMVSHIERLIETDEGSVSPADDMTVVVLEVIAEGFGPLGRPGRGRDRVGGAGSANRDPSLRTASARVQAGL